MEKFKRNNMIKTSVIILLALFFLPFGLKAQSDRVQVQAVIEQLFDGMRAKNTEMIAASFSSEAIMQTIAPTESGFQVSNGSVSDFIKRIGETPAETNLDERILEYEIKIDGPMATAWTPYEFYVNGNFSHCGVNSFQLVKLVEGWKIVYIIDTRRKEPCAT
jgi:hypothetical protein